MMPRETLLLRQSINRKVLYCGSGVRYLSGILVPGRVVFWVHIMHKTPDRCGTRGARCVRDYVAILKFMNKSVFGSLA